MSEVEMRKGSLGEKQSDFNEAGFIKIPLDWDAEIVSQIANDENKAFIDGDWIESDDMDDEGNIQLVQLGHIGKGRFKGKPNRFINEEFAEKENCTILKTKELLISRMQEPILRACLLPEFDQKSIMAVDIARLRPKEDWNKYFLMNLFNSTPVWKQGLAWASGTTRKRISRSNLSKIELQKPPLPEQRKIATVLYNVDQAIQKTEEIIEQTKRVKKGLMQDLFTEGYYEHDEFKETRLGPRKLEIPNDWTVKKIDEFAKVKGGKRLPKSHVYAKEKTKYPYLRVKDFKGGGIEQSELKYLKPKTFEKIKRYTISCNDVYISIAGTLGIAGTIPEDLDGANLTENAAKITNIKEVDHNYLALYLQSNFGQKEVHRFTVGSSQPKLSLFRIRKMEVLIPPREEQEKIVKIIKSAQKKLQKFKNEKQQLRRLKKGLMQDLLTGDVRTHDKDIEILDEVMEVEQSGS